MNDISKERKVLDAVLELISRHFGNEVEVVLHDLKKDGLQSIVNIVNGNITGREIGGTADKHGIQAIPGETENGNCFNEIIYTESGAVLKGSTVHIRDEDDNIIGSICINQDITASVKYLDYLKEKSGLTGYKNNSNDVYDILTSTIQEAMVEVGKHPSVMTKEDKIAFVRYLDDRGAFLISKSGPKVCETLGISKFTLYHYLDMIRNGDKNDDSEIE